MAASVTASSCVIVWEWMNEHGTWKPYKSTVSNYIEMNNNQNMPTISLGNVDSNLKIYFIDLTARCQIRQGTGTPRPIRRSVYPITSVYGQGILWYWEGETRGEWHIFSPELAQVVEDAYQQSPSRSVDLSRFPPHQPYVVDFARMTQMRIDTRRIRNIRREVLQTPYASQGSSQNMSNANNYSSANAGLSGQQQQQQQQQPPAKRQKTSHNLYASSSIVAVNNNPAHSNSSAIPPPLYSVSTASNTSFNPPTSSSSGPQPTVHGPLTRGRHNTLIGLNSSPSTSSQGLSTQSNLLKSNSSLGSQIPFGHANFFSMHQPNTFAMPIPFQNSGMSSLPGGMSLLGGFGNPGSQPFSMHQYGSGLLQGTSQSGIPTGVPGLAHNSNSGAGVHGNMLQGGGGPYHASSQFMPGLPGNIFKSRGASRVTPSANSGAAGASSGSDDFPLEGKISNNVPKYSKKNVNNDTHGMEVLSKYSSVINTPPEEDDCCICCERLNHPSGYGEGKPEANVVLQLSKCSHMLHKLCIMAMYDSGSKNGCLQCPTCKTIYGEKHGNCPRGTMEYHRIPQSLPGYSDCQTLRILYNISPGIQGPEHPNPGKKYSTSNFPRVGYLPDNEEGRKILKLLIVAWKRRLTFTIGTSATTGEPNTVTWNEIHHKTELGANYSGHGYPDPKYLDNVLMELAVHGVTEEELQT